jgi:hypothetical protein
MEDMATESEYEEVPIPESPVLAPGYIPHEHAQPDTYRGLPNWHDLDRVGETILNRKKTEQEEREEYLADQPHSTLCKCKFCEEGIASQCKRPDEEMDVDDDIPHSWKCQCKRCNTADCKSIGTASKMCSRCEYAIVGICIRRMESGWNDDYLADEMDCDMVIRLGAMSARTKTRMIKEYKKLDPDFSYRCIVQEVANREHGMM